MHFWYCYVRRTHFRDINAALLRTRTTSQHTISIAFPRLDNPKRPRHRTQSSVRGRINVMGTVRRAQGDKLTSKADRMLLVQSTYLRKRTSTYIKKRGVRHIVKPRDKRTVSRLNLCLLQEKLALPRISNSVHPWVGDEEQLSG